MCEPAQAAELPRNLRLDIPTAQVSAQAQSFDSIEQAVESALRLAAALTEKSRNEWGGMVLRNSAGGFVHTDPVTSNNDANVVYKLKVPEGHTPAAMYHTHPCDHQNSHKFSPNDVAMVQKLGIPSYIGDMCGKEARVYDTTSPGGRRAGRPVPSVNLR